MGLNVKGVDAGDRFLSELAGVSEETKLKYRTYLSSFYDESHLEDVKWLAQGQFIQMLLNLFL
jgi:GMP synthase (glutamine-hydrolysing)